MSLLTREKYRQLTKDQVPEGAPLQESIDLAQELVESFLHRKLDETAVTDETTIAYRQRYGTYLAFPEYMPVTSVVTAGWEYTNTGILKSASSGFSIVYNLDYINEIGTGQYEIVVSYTGGFTAATAPGRLLLCLAKMTKYLLSQNPATGISIPTSGISSMSIGGVSVSLDTENLSTNIVPPEIEILAKGFQRRRY